MTGGCILRRCAILPFWLKSSREISAGSQAMTRIAYRGPARTIPNVPSLGEGLPFLLSYHGIRGFRCRKQISVFLEKVLRDLQKLLGI